MLTRAFIDKIVRDLVMEGFVPGPQDKYGAAPCRDSFIGYINSSLYKDAQDCNGFIPVLMYPFAGVELPNEIGAIGNMRIVLDKKIDPSKIAVDSISRREFNIDME